MLVSSVHAVVAFYVTAPMICTLEREVHLFQLRVIVSPYTTMELYDKA